MTARRVACPKCKTQLMLPAGFTSGSIKCPKCAQVLAIRAPAPSAPAAPVQPAAPAQPTRPATPTPAMPAPVAPVDDPFANLPDLPAASAPSGGFPQYTPPPARPKPKPKQRTKKKSKKKSGGGGVGTAFAIIGSIVGVLMLVCCGGVGLVATGKIGPGHSGWKQATFHGYKVDMPGNGTQKQLTERGAGLTGYELVAQRSESGSFYGLAVTKVPGGQFDGSQLKQVYTNNPAISLSGLQDINRSGVPGIKGVVSGGDPKLIGAQVEIFYHNGSLVILSYRPYSVIKERIKGRKAPRSNEKELDKPDEFFSSIKFQ